MRIDLATGVIDPTVHTPSSLANGLRAMELAQQRKRERKAAAIALLKQRAEHDPVIDAIVAVLEL